MKVNLLHKDQISGEKKLEIFNDGITAEPTDLALLLGGETDKNNRQKKKFGRNISILIYYVLGQTEYDFNRLCVDTDGMIREMPVIWRFVSYRFITKKSKKTGMYPQSVASEAVSRELEEAFNSNRLKRTGKKYHFDKYYKEGNRNSYDKSNVINTKFEPLEFLEYRHTDGNKYIRIQARTAFWQKDIKVGKRKIKEMTDTHTLDTNSDVAGHEKIYFNANGILGYNFITKPEDDFVLSNGEYIDHDKFYWVKVEPIEWLWDKKFMVTKKLLFAGIRFEDSEEYIKKYFAKESNG